MGHPEASDEGTCYPISTHEQMEAAYERVGASCQVILDLHDRLQGKQLKAGLSLKQVVEFQNELVEIAEHIMTVATSTHEAQKTTSEVRKADHEISAQIQLILVCLICGTYVYGRQYKADTPAWDIPGLNFPLDWETAEEIALGIQEGEGHIWD